MKEFNRWRKKPSTNHAPCEAKRCNNFYNITYRDADGYCKPCKTRRKNEQESRSNRAS